MNENNNGNNNLANAAPPEGNNFAPRNPVPPPTRPASPPPPPPRINNFQSQPQRNNQTPPPVSSAPFSSRPVPPTPPPPPAPPAPPKPRFTPPPPPQFAPRKPKKGIATIAIVIAIVASIIIIGLMFVYYYVLTHEVSTTPVVNIPTQTPAAQSPTPVGFVTNVIHYAFPQTLPPQTKDGYCWVSSVAQPYRADAFRCMVDNSVYDPCFAGQTAGFVVCQMNPLLQGNAFVIKLTKPLPQISPVQAKENWAWFIEFEDGTFCAPYTGTKPFVAGYDIYYGCKSNTPGQTVVLLGELIKGDVWMAKKAVIAKNGATSTVVSQTDVRVKTIWQ